MVKMSAKDELVEYCRHLSGRARTNEELYAGVLAKLRFSPETKYECERYYVYYKEDVTRLVMALMGYRE